MSKTSCFRKHFHTIFVKKNPTIAEKCLDTASHAHSLPLSTQHWTWNGAPSGEEVVWFALEDTAASAKESGESPGEVRREKPYRVPGCT